MRTGLHCRRVVLVGEGVACFSNMLAITPRSLVSLLQAGTAPSAASAAAVLPWLASVASPPITERRITAGQLSFTAPRGLPGCRGGLLWVTVSGVPSTPAYFAYAAPAISNVAPDNRGQAKGFLRLVIDGTSFCRDATCGSLLLNGAAVAVAGVGAAWSDTQVIVIIAAPLAGSSTTVQV
jgi:hypothetical protein